MNRSIRLSLNFASITLLVACGTEGPTVADVDPLEADEATAVMAAVSEVLGGVLFQVGGAGSPRAAMSSANVPVSETLNVTARCPLGGSVTLTGTIKGDVAEEGDAASLRFELTEEIGGCRVIHGNTEFTIDGAPNLSFSGSLSLMVTDQSFWLDGSMTLRGGFSYIASDGRSGTCGVDVDYDFSTTKIEASGRVCGHPIQTSVRLG